MERDQADQVARRATERQRIEDGLQDRVEAAENVAADAGHPDSEEEKVQWENWMAELPEREDAVLQGQVSKNLNGAGVQCREVRINGPGLQKGTKATLPSRNATSDMDPLFFDDLRLEYPPIPEAILRSIINNSLQPISIMKLSTEFSEGITDKAEDKDLDSISLAFPAGVDKCLYCWSQSHFIKRGCRAFHEDLNSNRIHLNEDKRFVWGLISLGSNLS